MRVIELLAWNWIVHGSTIRAGKQVQGLGVVASPWVCARALVVTEIALI